MDLSNIPVPTTRHDGWTAARKVQFLEALAQDGSVCSACARVGLSREAAYRLRRREPLFDRAWSAAQLQAREIVGEVLGTRAINGIEEEIWYRGKVLGTRRRYDTRLLLAHMARLDKLAENRRAVGDAQRFDELLACVAGEPVPQELEGRADELPIDRQAAELRMGELAEEAASDDDGDEAYYSGAAEGGALWDDWFDGACGTVDALLEEGRGAPVAAVPRTLSTVSTSALAVAMSAAEESPQCADPRASAQGIPVPGQGGPSASLPDRES
jgi:hypothetical protein